MKKILLTLVIITIAVCSMAQGFERPRKMNTKTITLKKFSGPLASKTVTRPVNEYLQQFAFNASSSAPRLNVKTVKLYAKFGKKYVPLYLLNSIATIAPNVIDSAKNLANELQNLYGGLANGYLSKEWKITKGANEKEGILAAVNGGYKLTNSLKDKGAKSAFLNSAHVAAEFKGLIPLFADESSNNMQGVLQVKATGQAVYAIDQGVYKHFFDTPDADLKKVFFSVNIEGSLHLFDVFYVSGGGYFSNVSSIGRSGYVKITYSSNK